MKPWMSRCVHLLVAGALACCTGTALHAQTASANEARTSARLAALRSDPPALRSFLFRLPKGGDLHMHLSGAVYAETFLEDAQTDGLCVDTAKLAFARGAKAPACGAGSVPAAAAFTDQGLYDRLIDSFSMRSFVPTAGWSGHDQFFATFDRFGGTAKTHQGEWLDEVATRAAAQNEQYLEIMTTPDFSVALRLAAEMKWNGDAAKMRDALLSGGLRDNVATDRSELDDMDRRRNQMEHCGTPQAAPACTVQVRYLYQVLRSAPPERVFAQTLLGFELASVDPRVVGINFVQPEDAYMAMHEYARQMDMLHYLRGVYPKVHVSLHAGELAPGMTSPTAENSAHIRDAVFTAGAERIGHGVDVMYEPAAEDLLKSMAERHIMVEVNLTSNDVILNVKGKDHPLHDYMGAGVPFALSTDDEGVSRIDLTHEYERAVLEQGLTYAQLKASARASLEHSFLPGEDLWKSMDRYTAMQKGCASAEKPAAACEAFLRTSEKAAAQWELERRFRTFEAEMAKPAVRRAAKSRVQ
jgi:adenosine deaminase